MVAGGAVPPLVSELAVTLGDGQPGPVLDAGQQVRLPPAQVALSVAEREVSAAQLLRDSRRGHTQPPEDDTGDETGAAVSQGGDTTLR